MNGKRKYNSQGNEGGKIVTEDEMMKCNSNGGVNTTTTTTKK